MDIISVAKRTVIIVLAFAAAAACGDDASVGTAADALPRQTQETTALRLADLPLLLVDGEGLEYEFSRISGAVRFSDGTIVASARRSHEVRSFDPGGVHRWSVGQEGEGPGEFQNVRLLGACTTPDRIRVYDRFLRRISVLDDSGELVDDYPLTLPSYGVALQVECAPNGRFVMSDWGTDEDYANRFVAGPHRLTVSLLQVGEDNSGHALIREGIPGQDRFTYTMEGVEPISGPRRWARNAVYAATDRGVWLGTGDDYYLEYVEWDGQTTEDLRWAGRDLAVTADHRAARRESMRASYADDGPGWQAEFQDAWEQELEIMPDVFPSVSDVLVAKGGALWAERYRRPGEPERVWFVFEQGRWTKTLTLPSSIRVLDAGPDWVLAYTTDSVGIQRLGVYGIEEATP